MAVDRRHKDSDWYVADPEGRVYQDHKSLAVLMDIRDELKRSNAQTARLISLASCYRIPRALDGMYEVGKDLRRKKRAAAKKRKAKK